MKGSGKVHQTDVISPNCVIIVEMHGAAAEETPRHNTITIIPRHPEPSHNTITITMIPRQPDTMQ